jgi:hypothetical protein
LKPAFTPTYADNHNFAWEITQVVPPEGREYLEDLLREACILHYEGIDGSEDGGYPSAKISLTHVPGTEMVGYCYVVMATSKDPGLADYRVEIWVRGGVVN